MKFEIKYFTFPLLGFAKLDNVVCSFVSTQS